MNNEIRACRLLYGECAVRHDLNFLLAMNPLIKEELAQAVKIGPDPRKMALSGILGDPRHDLNFLTNMNVDHSGRLLQLINKSPSDLRQDLFVLSELNFKENGFFVEFGATNGISLSNTWLLEREFNWTGILAEPAHYWSPALEYNRPNSKIDRRCVWKTTGEKLMFQESELTELSSISSFVDADYHAKTRRKGKSYEVETVSLLDLLVDHNAPSEIDYLSIDTEGSEYDILENFDFSRFNFKVITCEHNFTDKRDKVYKLLTKHGYKRKFEKISKCEDWYVYN